MVAAAGPAATCDTIITSNKTRHSWFVFSGNFLLLFLRFKSPEEKREETERKNRVLDILQHKTLGRK